jgi:hypothetical protein
MRATTPSRTGEGDRSFDGSVEISGQPHSHLNGAVPGWAKG